MLSPMDVFFIFSLAYLSCVYLRNRLRKLESAFQAVTDDRDLAKTRLHSVLKRLTTLENKLNEMDNKITRVNLPEQRTKLNHLCHLIEDLHSKSKRNTQP